MSKRQKGRKHRTVNRTPRPVGPARHDRAATPVTRTSAATAPAPATTSAPASAAKTPAPKTSATETSAAETPAAKAPTPASKAPAAPPGTSGTEEAHAPVFTRAARDGGLGRPAARTWDELQVHRQKGAEVGELSDSAGFTAATIRKHLTGLERYGLAEQRDGRWYPTGKSQWDAVPEGAAEPAPA